MNGIISTKEAAARLNVSVRRVQNLIAAKRLPAEKIGNSYAIKESDLKLVKERKNGRPAKGKKLKEKDWNAILDKFIGCLDGGPPDLQQIRNI
jgi:excisionase family DNA binding protein